ncbi:unnamed protein product, partial [Ectocarpus sp. 13 AM-2016]
VSFRSAPLFRAKAAKRDLRVPPNSRTGSGTLPSQQAGDAWRWSNGGTSVVEDDDPRTARRPTIARASATLNLLLVSMTAMLKEMMTPQMRDWAPTPPGSNTHTPAFVCCCCFCF